MTRREAIQQSLFISGVAIGAPVVSILLEGCSTKEQGWTPLVFNSEEVRVLKNLSDLIFPSTDTPGASDVGVVQMIDKILADCYSSKKSTEIRDLLNDLNEDSRKAEEYLTELEEDAYGNGPGTNGKVYRDLKRLIVASYFTSEPVMTMLLDYHAIAGRHEGCIEMNPDQRVFVDNNV